MLSTFSEEYQNKYLSREKAEKECSVRHAQLELKKKIIF